MDRDKSGAEDPVNGELVDRYRQASAELDERPAASTRASILAAAARVVDARPVDAAAKPRTRPRWPLAAAAAVMLSTLAVMLAIRTNEEMPHFGATPETARSAADAVAPSAKPARSAADASAPSAAPASTPPTVDPAPRQREESQERVTDITEKRQVQTRNERAARANKESDSVAQAPRETSPALAEARGKKDSGSVPQAPREADRPAPAAAPAPPPVTALEKARQDAPAVTPAPPAPESTDRPKQRAEQPAAGAVAPPAPMDQASAGARRDMGRLATPPLSSAQSERKQVEESAAAWLERIIKLRREGRHDEADAELKRFRERYPQVQPPSEALGPVQPPAGTR